MLKLNIYNGNIILDNYSFSCKDNTSELKNVFLKDLLLWSVNNEYQTFKLNYSESLIVLFHFFKDSISSVELYSKNNSIENVLNDIGGEKKYSWGSVYLNIDIKAGYKSVIVQYNLVFK